MGSINLILRPKLSIPFIILMVILVGCSSGKVNPVELCPVNGGDIPSEKQPASSSSSHQMWGLWQFTADPAKQILNITPLRSASWHQNVLPFLEPPVLTKLTLESVEFTNAFTVDAMIGLTHPFPGLEEFTGFDVCGIVFTIGTNNGYGGGIITTRPPDTRLANPDGFTRWWNPMEFPHVPIYGYTDGLLGTPDSYAGYNCHINGYKYHSDELNAYEDLSGISMDSRGQFSAGVKNIRRYIIEIGPTQLVFNYAVDACWEPPVGPAPWEVPDDFPEGANRAEAYRIEVTEVTNTLYYEDYPPYGGGSVMLQVDVYDWFNAGENTLTLRTGCGIPPVLNITPTEVFEGYTRFILNLDGSTLDVNDDVELLFIITSGDVGYQGFIPGEPLCAYFPYTLNITDPTPDSGWGHTWGNKAATAARGIALDDSANIYVTGTFDKYSGGVDFDPGPGTDIHESNGMFDIYLSRFSNNGSFAWARSWGGTRNDYAYDVACDHQNNAYVTGLFRGTVDFDPGPGVEERTSVYSQGDPTDDIYLSKFNDAGQLLWVHCWGGDGSPFSPGNDCAYGLTVDSSNCVYVTGNFTNEVDLDPGPGVDLHNVGGNSTKLFLSKFDSDGNYQWGLSWGSGGMYYYSYAVAIDDYDNILVTGQFDGTTDFDPGPGTDWHSPVGNNISAFMSKFNSDGIYQWGRTWGAIGDFFPGSTGSGVAVDGYGNILVTGDFSGECDFDPGSGVETRYGDDVGDAFLSKFSPSGDFLWVRTWGGDDGDYASSVAADDLGYVCVTSASIYPVDLDPGPEIDMHIPHAMHWDFSLSKFSPDGDYIWGHMWGADTSNRGDEVLVDDQGRIYLTGWCYFPIELDPGPDMDIHNTGPSGFLMKILPDGYW